MSFTFSNRRCEEEPLPYDEFHHDNFNNFFQFFYLGFAADCYRTTALYHRFCEEAPELNTLLLEAFKACVDQKNRPIIEEDLRQQKLKKPLYEAYLIMRTYVESDGEIFK